MDKFNNAREDMQSAWESGNKEDAQNAALNYAYASESGPEALKIDLQALDAAIDAELGSEVKISEEAKLSVTESMVAENINRLTENIVAVHPEHTSEDIQDHLEKSYERFYTNLSEQYQNRYDDDEIAEKALAKLKTMVNTGSLKKI